MMGCENFESDESHQSCAAPRKEVDLVLDCTHEVISSQLELSAFIDDMNQFGILCIWSLEVIKLVDAFSAGRVLWRE
jgi:hypothetical protein